MKKQLISVALAVLLFAGSAYAQAPTGDRTNWYVNPVTGSNSNNGTVPALAWRGLEFALANASVGDGDNIVIIGRVTLASETAASGDMQEISPADPNITIRGYTGNPADAVIDFSGTTYTTQDGISVENATLDGFSLRDLTIANYRCSGTRSAVYIYNGTSGASGGVNNVIIDNVTFSNCGPTTTSNAVALYIQHDTTQQATQWGQNVTVNNCRFVDMGPLWSARLALRGATSGGGYENWNVTNCQFNTVSDLQYRSGAAGGITATNIDSLVISGCTFYAAGNWGPSTTDETDDPEVINLDACDRVHIQDCFSQRYLFGFKIGVTTVVSRPGEPQVLVLASGDHPLHNSNGFQTYDGTGVGTSDSLYVERCTWWGAGHGFDLDNLGPLYIRDCVFDSTYDDGGFIESAVTGGAGSEIARNTIHYAGNNGLDITGDGIKILHNTIVRANNGALRVLSASSGCYIRSNLVYDVTAIVPASGTGPVVNAMVELGDATGGAPVGITSWNYNGYYDTQINDRQFLNITAPATGTYEFFAGWQALGRDSVGFVSDPLFYNVNGDPISQPGCFRVKTTGSAYNAGHDGLSIGASPAWSDNNFINQPVSQNEVKSYQAGYQNAYGQTQFIATGAPTVKLTFVPGFPTSSFSLWAHTRATITSATEQMRMAWSGLHDNISTSPTGLKTADFFTNEPVQRTWFVNADTIKVWVRDNALAASDSVFVTFTAYPR